MPILDRFRTARPEWEHADPQVRAEAVRRLARRERDLLVSIARTDQEAQVRRVAVHKLDEPDVLTEVARSDSDAGVRDEACEALLRVACNGEAPAALRALEALSEPRQVLAAARDAKLEAVRGAALNRIDDPRALATLAKTSEHADSRLAALISIDDPELLLDVALKSDHRDSAVAALDRLDDEAALESVAAHGRNKAASRRAKTRLEKLRPDAEPEAGQDSAPAGAEEATPSGAEEAVAATSETSAPAPEPEPPEDPALVARRGLCERLDALKTTAAEEDLAALEAEWEALAPTALPGAAALAARFEKAAKRQRERAELQQRIEQTRPEQEAACAALEALGAAEDHPSAQDWSAAESAWKTIEAAGPVDPELAHRVSEVARQRRESESKEAEERKQRLIAAAERLEALSKAEALDLRETEAALREAREAVNDPGRLPSRRDREQLLERVRAARASIFPKAQELREADEWTRWANVATLEELCTRVEALVASEDLDLDALARELRDVDARWKQAHPVPRDEGATLWRRFRKSREPLRERVGEHLKKRRAERQTSLARRKELVARADALKESSDWVATARELQALQAEWKALPPVGRRQSDALWKPFHEACQAFFARRKADLQSRRKEQAANLEKKQALVARAEALKDSTDWEKAAAEVRTLQAEWKQAGPVRRARADAVWEQFKAACDAFFERYRHKDEIVDEAALAERTAVCEALEALRPGEGESAPEDLAAQVAAQLEVWRGLAPVRGAQRAALEERFREARDRLVREHPDAFAKTDLDPNASLPRREKLCERVEAHLPSHKPVDLATQLREALAANALGGASVAQARARESANDIREARAAWERLGPVIGDAARALETRFETACKRFDAAFPNASAPLPGMTPGRREGRGRPKPKGRRPRPRG